MTTGEQTNESEQAPSAEMDDAMDQKKSSPGEAPHNAELRKAVTDQIGGVRGMLETTVPVVVFVAINIVAGLKPALWAAVGAAVVIAAIRLLQRDSIRHAVTGLFGVVIAAIFAAKTGRAQDFYLPGIALNFVYATAFGISAAIRRPLVGYAWSLVTGADGDWQQRPRLMRAFTWLSIMWAAMFVLRGGVQLVFYLLSMPIGLGIARIVGIAPYAAALAVTVWCGRRVVFADNAAKNSETL